MRKVKAINVHTTLTVKGHVIESAADLLEAITTGEIHPLKVKGMSEILKGGETIFINEKGGYCPVEGNYTIHSEKDESLRSLMLFSLYETKAKEGEFKKTLMRWQSFNFKNKHISEVDFESLTDKELLHVFERITRRVNVQM